MYISICLYFTCNYYGVKQQLNNDCIYLPYLCKR